MKEAPNYTTAFLVMAFVNLVTALLCFQLNVHTNFDTIIEFCAAFEVNFAIGYCGETTVILACSVVLTSETKPLLHTSLSEVGEFTLPPCRCP